MGEQQAYVRIYWSIIDDPKFVDVYDNDAALATWLRLLISADASWPASASIPAAARRVPLALLVGAGLVDLMQGGRYRIHGLDSERNARSASGRNAAAMRWHREGNAPAMRPHSEGIPTRNADLMPSRAEPSRDKQRVNGVLGKEGARAITARGPSEAVS